MSSLFDPSDRLDKQAVAQSFSKAAKDYDRVASLQGQVFAGLCSRLMATESRIHLLDIGCGTATLTRQLTGLFPRAVIVGLDIAPGMLQFASEHKAEHKAEHNAEQQPIRFVCGDAERLPFAPDAFDVVVSNFALQWCVDYAAVFNAIGSVLKPGGRLVFSVPGEGTLRELSASWQQADPAHRHVNRFPSQALLDQAARLGGFQHRRFSQETRVVEYDRLRELMTELKTLGAHNVTQGRSRQLTSKRTLTKLMIAYEQFRNSAGKLPASWRIIQGELIK